MARTYNLWFPQCAPAWQSLRSPSRRPVCVVREVYVGFRNGDIESPSLGLASLVTSLGDERLDHQEAQADRSCDLARARGHAQHVGPRALHIIAH